MSTMDIATQIYNILKKPDNRYLTKVYNIIYFLLSFQMHDAVKDLKLPGISY